MPHSSRLSGQHAHNLTQHVALKTVSSINQHPPRVRLPEPLDRALLDRLVIESNRAGNAIPGRASVAREKTIGRVHVIGSWRAGDSRLAIIGSGMESMVSWSAFPDPTIASSLRILGNHG